MGLLVGFGPWPSRVFTLGPYPTPVLWGGRSGGALVLAEAGRGGSLAAPGRRTPGARAERGRTAALEDLPDHGGFVPLPED